MLQRTSKLSKSMKSKEVLIFAPVASNSWNMARGEEKEEEWKSGYSSNNLWCFDTLQFHISEYEMRSFHNHRTCGKKTLENGDRIER